MVPLESDDRQIRADDDLGAVATSLERTLRLDRVELRGWSTPALAAGGTARHHLNNPGGLTAFVTLLRFDSVEARYAVRLGLGEQTLVDTEIQVALGERAVVGALDGPRAPYVFLVVEAREQVSGAPAPPELTAPEPLEEIQVAYTEPARAARLTGVVILAVEVDAAGTVGDVRVLKGLPFGLDLEAVRAVKATPFAPALDASGQPIASTVNLAIKFRQEEEP